jgi:hypothetical protein
MQAPEDRDRRVQRQEGKVTIHTARPGIIIGKKGAEVENLRKALQKLTKKEIFINIQEVKRAEIDAQLVAENVALQLERRVGFRRVMKKAVTTAMKLGAKGIKIACAGRLAEPKWCGEWYREGRVPSIPSGRISILVWPKEDDLRADRGQVWLFKGDLPDQRGGGESNLAMINHQQQSQWALEVR